MPDINVLQTKTLEELQELRDQGLANFDESINGLDFADALNKQKLMSEILMYDALLASSNLIKANQPEPPEEE